MERDITKLNVVRRINFDELKDEINNAKVQNQIERRRYVTRSSVKKNTDRTSQANSGANTPNHTQSDTCSKYELKEDPDREQYFNQKSTDDDHMLTRKRKREAQTELLESEDKEIKVVITPIKICDGEIRSDKKNTKEKEKQETFPEEPIDWDIQDDEVKNTEIDKPLLRKRDVQRSYVDFLSDNEDFEWSSTSWEGSIESESETDIKTKKKKKKNTKNQNHSVFDNMQNSDMDLLDLRTKRRRVNKRVARQLSKERGEEYITRNGKHVPGKYVKGNMYA
ncbi:hypothetical protein MSG28_005073 [Choristoneura fumiferana]|uniref:Uncharacterized protein n=1 Tax=Choristoneura fumiferana TaxID=7141 RepID=A0ACC0JQ40_CHOFU|nr:hypothetical protein MSG28_005073 [Choristoneura fumiferana]